MAGPDAAIGHPTTSADARLQQRLLALERTASQNARRISQTVPSGETPFGSWFMTQAIAGGATAGYTANVCWYQEVKVLSGGALTGLAYWIASAGTGNARSVLYDASGVRVANRSTASAVPASGLHRVAFDAPVSVEAGVYFAGMVFTSAAPSIYSGVHLCPSGHVAGPGAGATPTSITPPTSPDTGGGMLISTY